MCADADAVEAGPGPVFDMDAGKDASNEADGEVEVTTPPEVRGSMDTTPEPRAGVNEDSPSGSNEDSTREASESAAAAAAAAVRDSEREGGPGGTGAPESVLFAMEGRTGPEGAESDASMCSSLACEAQRKALEVLDDVLRRAMHRVEDFLADDTRDEGLDEDLGETIDEALNEAMDWVLDEGVGAADGLEVAAPCCSRSPNLPPCEDCPPPLVRSVETGECELPEVDGEVTAEGAAEPQGATGGATDDRDRRPKFRVSVSGPREDDVDLLSVIAEFACEVGHLSARNAQTNSACAPEDQPGQPSPAQSMAATAPVAAELQDAQTASCENSDEGSASSRRSEEGPEGRTVTAAEGAILAIEVAAKASDSVAGKNNGRSDGRIVSLEEAVRLTGQGWFHVKLLLVCGFLVMAAVLETVVVGYLLPSATLDLGMSDGDKGLLGAASYAGIVLSSHTWGLVADTQGRKRALLWATLLDVVASLASSVAPNFETLLTLRFFCGLFTSAPAALTFAYLGEFHTPASRSRSIIWIGAFPSLGLIVLPGVAWAVLPQCWAVDLGFVQFGPWRLLLVLCALLSLVSGLLLLVAVPESPKFLASRRPDEALVVLRRMFTLNKGCPETLYPVDALLEAPDKSPTVATVEAAVGKAGKASPSMGLGRTLHLVWLQTAPLFKPPYLLHTTLVCLVQFGNLASANGLQIWLPDIFNKLAQYEVDHPDLPAKICASQHSGQLTAAAAAAGAVSQRWLSLEALAGPYNDAAFVEVGLGAPTPVCAPVKQAVFVNNMIIGAVSLAMPLLCGLIVNVVGKRNLLVVCLAVSGAFGVLLSVVGSSGAILGLASVSVAINAMGIGHISSIVVELFPTHLRAMAVSLHLMAGRTGSIVGNLIFGMLLHTQCELAFYAIGGALLTCAVLTCFLPAKGKFAS